MRQTRQEMFIHHISTIIHRSNLGRNSERVIQEKIKKEQNQQLHQKLHFFITHLLYCVGMEPPAALICCCSCNNESIQGT